MTQPKQPPPIRPRDDRVPGPGFPESSTLAVDGDVQPDGADPIDEVRRQALSMGYQVRKEPRARRPRPDAKDGRISTTCRFHPGVRAVMDQARLELNMNYSDMVNIGVIMFLESQNLRIDVDPRQFFPSP